VDSALFWPLLSTLVGGLATLAIFSFLIRENGFYRLFEHVFIGIAAGIGPMLTLRDFLWPQIIDPMRGATITTYPDGTLSGPYQPLYLLYLVPMIFGALYYALYSPRYAWIAKVVIGFTLGASGALAIRGFFAEVIPQLAGSFKPLVVISPGAKLFLLYFWKRGISSGKERASRTSAFDGLLRSFLRINCHGTTGVTR
jgi:hypothetical protein